MAKGMDRDRPIFVEVNGWARRLRSAAESSIPIAIFWNHGAEIAAQTTRFWARSLRRSTQAVTLYQDTNVNNIK